MAETQIGLVRNVLISPWYGALYDILLTDQRLVFVFVEKLTRKTKAFFEQPSRWPAYDKVDLKAASAGKGNFSIPLSSINWCGARSTVGTLGGSIFSVNVFHVVTLRYHTQAAQNRELKIWLIAPVKLLGRPPLAISDPDSNQLAIQRGYVDSIKQLLLRVLPPSVLRDTDWEI